jgi:competence protein ComEC
MRVDVDPAVQGEDGAALTLERYRDTQRRYWMEQ